MTIHKDLIQGSDEWLKKKAGCFSASNAKNLFSKPSTAAYQNLINAVVAGRVFGLVEKGFKSSAMRWGNDYEPFAREWYELEMFQKVEQVGFVELSEFVGCSPDGLVGGDGLLEIKCPQINTHIGYLLNKKVPSEYYWQMQFQMYVCDRKWCDFLSFYPDENVPNWLVRVERSQEDIDKLTIELARVIEIAEKRINQLKG